MDIPRDSVTIVACAMAPRMKGNMWHVGVHVHVDGLRMSISDIGCMAFLIDSEDLDKGIYWFNGSAPVLLCGVPQERSQHHNGVYASTGAGAPHHTCYMQANGPLVENYFFSDMAKEQFYSVQYSLSKVKIRTHG